MEQAAQREHDAPRDELHFTLKARNQNVFSDKQVKGP